MALLRPNSRIRGLAAVGRYFRANEALPGLRPAGASTGSPVPLGGLSITPICPRESTVGLGPGRADSPSRRGFGTRLAITREQCRDEDNLEPGRVRGPIQRVEGERRMGLLTRIADTQRRRDRDKACCPYRHHDPADPMRRSPPDAVGQRNARGAKTRISPHAAHPVADGDAQGRHEADRPAADSSVNTTMARTRRTRWDGLPHCNRRRPGEARHGHLQYMRGPLLANGTIGFEARRVKPKSMAHRCFGAFRASTPGPRGTAAAGHVTIRARPPRRTQTRAANKRKRERDATEPTKSPIVRQRSISPEGP